MKFKSSNIANIQFTVKSKKLRNIKQKSSLAEKIKEMRL